MWQLLPSLKVEQQFTYCDVAGIAPNNTGGVTGDLMKFLQKK